MESDPKIKAEKLVGASNWAKWKWQMNRHFDQYDMMSLIDRSWKRPNITNTEKESEDDQKNLLTWKHENAQMVVLIASVLSQLVADWVLMYSDVRDNGDKLISVYEQRSIQ